MNHMGVYFFHLFQNPNGETMDRVTQFRELTKKYFWFLVTDFNLYYIEKENLFTNNKVSIYISDFDRLIPNIQLWLKSEPLFTRLSLSWFVSERETASSLEDNFAYYSNVFREHAPELINKLDNLLLPALKRFYISLFEMQNMSSEEFLKKNFYYKQLFDYIKEKDPLWNPDANR